MSFFSGNIKKQLFVKKKFFPEKQFLGNIKISRSLLLITIKNEWFSPSSKPSVIVEKLGRGRSKWTKCKSKSQRKKKKKGGVLTYQNKLNVGRNVNTSCYIGISNQLSFSPIGWKQDAEKLEPWYVPMLKVSCHKLQ